MVNESKNINLENEGHLPIKQLVVVLQVDSRPTRSHYHECDKMQMLEYTQRLLKLRYKGGYKSLHCTDNFFNEA